MPVNWKNAESRLPAYQLIQNKLLEELSFNKFKIGDSYYTEKALIAKFNVAKMTIRNALGFLENQGYIYRRQGAGAFVAALPGKPQRIKIVKHCTVGIIPGKRGFKGQMPWLRILMNLHEQAARNGYLLYLGSDEVAPFIDAQAEGLILLGKLEERNLKILKESGMPTVSMSSQYTGIFPSIIADRRQSGYHSYQYLYQRGHRKIVLVGQGRDAETVEHSMRPGVLEALAELNIPPAQLRSHVGPAAYEQLQKRLISPEPVDALILMNGNAIAPVLQILNEAGLKVPVDLAILVHGEKAMEMNTVPPLSIIRYDFEKAAAKALAMLIDLIRGNSPADALYGSHIVERGSCPARNPR